MRTVQLLTPDGHLVTDPEYQPGRTDAQLAGDLRTMELSRCLDTEATWLQRKGELALWPPNTGQEAAQVGSVTAASANDIIIPSYREHAVALHQGVTPTELLAPFRGSTMIPWDPQLLHPYSFVIGSQALLAVGRAQALNLDAERAGSAAPGRAVLVYFGDGATSQGDVNEAFVFAAAWKAPVVFLLQNNQWAISAPVSVQSPIELARRADGFGFPGIQVDGNDLLAVHAVTAAALDRARNGGGPTLIEAVTYRMGAHTTSDDPTRYRRVEEVETWRDRDPITRLRTHLAEVGVLDENWKTETKRQCETLAHEIRNNVPALPAPELATSFATVYAENNG